MLGPTARAFGSPMPCEYGGKTIVAYGRIQSVYAEIETEYLRRHPDPLVIYRQKVAAGLFPDPQERQQFLACCVEQACQLQDAASADILNWLGTGPGTIFYGTLTAKWPVKDGTPIADAPYLTTEEMTQLFRDEIAANIRQRIVKAESAERAAADAENAAILAFHQLVNAASGSDLVGKETGPSSSATESKTPTG